MSVQSDIHEFLATVAKGANGDFIPMDPGKVAEQTGTTRNKVNKTLFNLTTTGKIELQRAENGRHITGFKLLEGPRERKTRATRTITGGRQRLSSPVTIMPGQARRRRSIPTPKLDEYAASREKFERLTSELGELVHAEFVANDYAEEGLMLRQRLDSIEGNYGELVARNEELERDVRALRRIANREQAASVAETSVRNGD